MADTSENPSPLQVAVRRAIDDSGKSRDHFDRLIQQRTGKKNKVLYDIERGKSKKPGMDTLQLVAEVLGLPLTYFSSPTVSTVRVADEPPTQLAHANDDLVEIVSLDLRFSMGPGTTIDDYIEETPMRFSLDFIRTFTRTPPNRLRRAMGVGDSMFPTLLDSDAVWIDTTQRLLNLNDRIWAISLFGAAGIKRLRPIGKGKILVISDNPAVPDQEVDEEDLIIGGRVVRLERGL